MGPRRNPWHGFGGRRRPVRGPACGQSTARRAWDAASWERHSIFGGRTMSIPHTPQTPAGAPSCYRHPDRTTFVQCTRCGRPVCGECMRSAAVGQQCVDCVAAAAHSVPPARTGAGGIRRSGLPVVTYALIAVNVVMFVLQMTSKDLQRELVLWAPGVAGGEYFRLITSAFMHYGAMH